MGTISLAYWRATSSKHDCTSSSVDLALHSAIAVCIEPPPYFICPGKLGLVIHRHGTSPSTAHCANFCSLHTSTTSCVANFRLVISGFINLSVTQESSRIHMPHATLTSIPRALDRFAGTFPENIYKNPE